QRPLSVSPRIVAARPGRRLRRHRGMGASAVVSLVQAAELKSPALDDLGAHARRRAMEWYHLPIRDAATPDSEFEARWVEAGARLRACSSNWARSRARRSSACARRGPVRSRPRRRRTTSWRAGWWRSERVSVYLKWTLTVERVRT